MTEHLSYRPFVTLEFQVDHPSPLKPLNYLSPYSQSLCTGGPTLGPLFWKVFDTMDYARLELYKSHPDWQEKFQGQFQSVKISTAGIPLCFKAVTERFDPPVTDKDSCICCFLLHIYVYILCYYCFLLHIYVYILCYYIYIYILCFFIYLFFIAYT